MAQTENRYTSERNAQILISLLKRNNIRKVIISPGTTNVCFAGSLLNDSFFEIYSAVDERSAAYMACGMAVESGEPVVLSCTGATSSRNYMPALTEAFYRKIPVLAVTSSQRSIRIGHNIDQVTDRTLLPRDVALMSVQMPVVYDEEMAWACMIAANKALLELKHRGGGPVHINLETNYNSDFSVVTLPEVKQIYRHSDIAEFPKLEAEKVTVVCGAHMPWSKKLINAIDNFCEKHNGIVLCDHTSNYKGKYGISPNLAFAQSHYISCLKSTDLLIHIGDISAVKLNIKCNQVWRVNPDGEIRDTYKGIKRIFECDESTFFGFYSEGNDREMTYYYESIRERDLLLSKIPELPLSNIWIAKQTISKLPENSVLHLAIRNSYRSWNFFPLPESVLCYCNTGGFGIDGGMSSLIGASLASSQKKFYYVTGDLAFFYDMNSLGCRHIGNNICIILVNNGTAMEMRFKSNLTSHFGDKGAQFLAATGHFGYQSTDLVKHYAEDMGFEYYSVHDKTEYDEIIPHITSAKMFEKPILVEVFTSTDDEENALHILSEIESSSKEVVKGVLRKIKNSFT